MSSYSELIKNFEKIRAYMRDFYVYGFKSRDDYSSKSSKSARSYDDERRRLESWLGDHMSFVRTPEGKNIFISIDSRTIRHNPLYNAWKAKSFTDGDITLHFIIFDILHDPSVKRTISELLAEIDEKYLWGFECPMMFDESTLRKKLKEYCEAGIIVAEKEGRKIHYRRAKSTDIAELDEVLHYFSEVSPCGVIGSFLLDKGEPKPDRFAFKHHYITGAIDSDVMAALFFAMREKRSVSLVNLSRKSSEQREVNIVPLKIYISSQSGRAYLLAYWPKFDAINPFRLDYVSNVILSDEEPRFDELRAMLDGMKDKIWGVNPPRNIKSDQTQHVEFTVRVEENEEYIVRRLEREKRVGNVERVDDNHYRFSCDVYDPTEMIPWIRTFICRITDIHISPYEVEKRFKRDIEQMYDIYGIRREESNDIQ